VTEATPSLATPERSRSGVAPVSGSDRTRQRPVRVLVGSDPLAWSRSVIAADRFAAIRPDAVRAPAPLAVALAVALLAPDPPPLR
jgi:hypothetical protein